MGMPIICSTNICGAQAAVDVVESIALEQAALAHILNAEGEKLQKIVACQHIDVDKLLDANASVESLIKSVTELECLLVKKLETVVALAAKKPCQHKPPHHG